MSKQTLFAALVLVSFVLLASNPLGVAAQGPLVNGAIYMDNQSHSIGPGATQWYAFDYAGDRQVVTVTLFNGAQMGWAFNVYAPDKPLDTPIGRGTQGKVACNNGDRCPSPDLTWVGGTSSPGTYYVELISKTLADTNFLLNVSSPSVTIYPSSQPVAASASSVPYVPPYVPAPYTPPNVAAPYTPPYVPAPYTPPYVPAPYTPPYVPAPYAPPYVPAPYAPAYVPPYVPGPYVAPYPPAYIQPYVPPYCPPAYVPPPPQYRPPPNYYVPRHVPWRR